MKNPELVAELIAKLKAECEYRFEFDAVATFTQIVSKTPRVNVIDDNHQSFNGKRYYKRTQDGHFYRSGNRPLHRAVWELFFGDIPAGCIIHHVDENPANNDIENLQCVTPAEHRRIHNEKRIERLEKKTFVCTICGKEYTAIDTGRNKFCSVTCQMKDYYDHLPLLTKICSWCGKQFTTKDTETRYCSDSCGLHARYAENKQVKTCPVCNSTFTVSKNSHRIYCSRKCSGKAHSLKIERICVICGNPFTTRPSEDCQTCSKECGQKLMSKTKQAQSSNIIKICPICGKEFKSYPSQNKKTCSKKCGAKLNRQNRKAKNSHQINA